MNRLADAYKSGLAKVQAKESLAFLVQYTSEHFQAEEQFMRELGYPGLGPHMAQHAALVEKAHDLQAKHEQGAANAMEVTIFLADWLTHHIDEVDMEYVAFMRENNGSEASPRSSS
jgi:hemerythrin